MVEGSGADRAWLVPSCMRNSRVIRPNAATTWMAHGRPWQTRSGAGPPPTKVRGGHALFCRSQLLPAIFFQPFGALTQQHRNLLPHGSCVSRTRVALAQADMRESAARSRKWSTRPDGQRTSIVVDHPRRPEAEVEPRVARRLVAAAADPPGGLAAAAGRDRHPGADGVAVRRRSPPAGGSGSGRPASVRLWK